MEWKQIGRTRAWGTGWAGQQAPACFLLPWARCLLTYQLSILFSKHSSGAGLCLAPQARLHQTSSFGVLLPPPGEGRLGLLLPCSRGTVHTTPQSLHIPHCAEVIPHSPSAVNSIFQSPLLLTPPSECPSPAPAPYSMLGTVNGKDWRYTLVCYLLEVSPLHSPLPTPYSMGNVPVLASLLLPPATMSLGLYLLLTSSYFFS